MIVGQLITDNIPPIKSTDTIGQALAWMSQFGVRHLPVVDDAKLVGIICEDDLLVAQDPDKTIVEAELSMMTEKYVQMDHHVYEALKVMALNQLDIVPVLDYDDEYEGLVNGYDVLDYLSEALNVHEPGGVVILRISQNSYQLSEIGRICESNSTKVLSLTVTNSPDASFLFVTLKVNTRDLTRLISTFERFEYEIASVIFDNEELEEYRENYEALLRYLRV